MFSAKPSNQVRHMSTRVHKFWFAATTSQTSNKECKQMTVNSRMYRTVNHGIIY